MEVLNVLTNLIIKSEFVITLYIKSQAKQQIKSYKIALFSIFQMPSSRRYVWHVGLKWAWQTVYIPIVPENYPHCV